MSSASTGEGGQPIKRNPRRRRRVLFIVAGLTIVCAVALAVSDMILFYVERRYSSPQDPFVAARLKKPHIYEDTTGGYRLRRFLDESYTDPISGREVRLRTNNLGYRGAHVGPKPPGECRILILGDSITLASFAEEEETYPNIVETLLNKGEQPTEGGMATALGGHAPSLGSAGASPSQSVTPPIQRFRILNAGISGAALREELLVLNETGLLAQPDAVIVGLFLNDATRSRMFPIPEGLAAYSAIARRFARAELAGEMREEAREEYIRLSGQPFPETEYPADAWRKDPAAFEAKVAKACNDWGRGFFPWAWSEMRPDFEVMRGLSREHSFKLAVVLFPATIQWEAEFPDDRPQKMFAALMTELAIPHLDLLPILRAEYARQTRSLSYDHGHLRPEGNRIVAEAIARFLNRAILSPK